MQDDTPQPHDTPMPTSPVMPDNNVGMPPMVTVSSHAPQKPQRPAFSLKKRGLLYGVVAVVAVLAIAAGIVFGLYLPNTPDNVYKTGLANTGKGADQLVDYLKQQSQAGPKGADFNATVKVKSASGSFDLDVIGSYDKDANATASMNADILGEKLTADVRSVHTAGNSTPDVYLRVGGIKSLLDAAGMSDFDNLSNQWVAVDHTLIDTYLASINKRAGGASSTSDKFSWPTNEQAEDALVKMQAVNKQYLFSTNPSTAVMTNEKFIAEEKQDGRTVDHYTVGYNKANLKAYVSALTSAVDGSKLNDWYKSVSGGKNYSDALDLSSLKSSIDNAKSDYTFDVWIDKGMKVISKVSFKDPSDSSSAITISQGYTGASTYPISMSFTGKDSQGRAQSMQLNANVDTVTNKVTEQITASVEESDGTLNIDANIAVTPTTKPVTVTTPQGAKSIIDILNELGLGDVTNNPSLPALSI